MKAVTRDEKDLSATIIAILPDNINDAIKVLAFTLTNILADRNAMSIDEYQLMFDEYYTHFCNLERLE